MPFFKVRETKTMNCNEMGGNGIKMIIKVKLLELIHFILEHVIKKREIVKYCNIYYRRTKRKIVINNTHNAFLFKVTETKTMNCPKWEENGITIIFKLLELIHVILEHV